MLGNTKIMVLEKCFVYLLFWPSFSLLRIHWPDIGVNGIQDLWFQRQTWIQRLPLLLPGYELLPVVSMKEENTVNENT